MERKYENQELIDKYETVANQILSEDRENTRRENFFPEFINRLHSDTFVEVGVDKADFSRCILSKTNISAFFGVDPWIDNFGSNHRPGYFDPKGENRMETAKKNIEEFHGRYTLIKDYSVGASNKFGSNSVDCCYIDGDHSLEGIMFDLYTWLPKVKYGGILSGHDYKDGRNSGIRDYWGEQLDYKVKTSVDYFCQRYGFKLNTVGGHVPSWWFVKNRKTI